MSIKDIKCDGNSSNNIIDIPNGSFGIETNNSNEIRNNQSISNDGKIVLYNDVITSNANATSNNLVTSSGSLNDRFNEIESDIINLGSVTNDNTIFSVVDDDANNRKLISTVKSGEKCAGTNTVTTSTIVIQCTDTSLFEGSNTSIRIVNKENTAKFHIAEVTSVSSNTSITISPALDLNDFPNPTDVDLYTMNYNTCMQVGDVIGTSYDDMMQSLLMWNTPTKSYLQVVPQGDKDTSKVLQIASRSGNNLQTLELKSAETKLYGNVEVDGSLDVGGNVWLGDTGVLRTNTIEPGLGSGVKVNSLLTNKSCFIDGYVSATTGITLTTTFISIAAFVANGTIMESNPLNIEFNNSGAATNIYFKSSYLFGYYRVSINISLYGAVTADSMEIGLFSYDTDPVSYYNYAEVGSSGSGGGSFTKIIKVDADHRNWKVQLSGIHSSNLNHIKIKYASISAEYISDL